MGRVTNKYGETIGYTPGAGYTDYSDEAAGIHGGPQYANTPWSGGGSSDSASPNDVDLGHYSPADPSMNPGGSSDSTPPAGAYGPFWSSAMLDAVKRKAFGGQSAPSGPTWSWPEFPDFQMPQVTPPAKVETEPTVEGVEPAEPPKAEEKKLPAGVRSGRAGFESVMSSVAAPSVDDLLKTYESVFGPQEGKAEEYARQYLTSPYFQRVLGGAVPMWMSADPLWHVYLQRLGLLKDAVEKRLGTD